MQIRIPNNPPPVAPAPKHKRHPAPFKRPQRVADPRAHGYPAHEAQGRGAKRTALRPHTVAALEVAGGDLRALPGLLVRGVQGEEGEVEGESPGFGEEPEGEGEGEGDEDAGFVGA